MRKPSLYHDRVCVCVFTQRYRISSLFDPKKINMEELIEKANILSFYTYIQLTLVDEIEFWKLVWKKVSKKKNNEFQNKKKFAIYFTVQTLKSSNHNGYELWKKGYELKIIIYHNHHHHHHEVLIREVFKKKCEKNTDH